MLKKITLLLLIIVLIFNLVGCGDKLELPEGVENEEFYKDMIKCLDLTKKALKDKNMKYVDDMHDIILSYALDENKNNIELTDKESEIMKKMATLHLNLETYLDVYFEVDDINVNVLVDTDSLVGKTLLKDFQEIVGYMEIDYDLGLID